MKPFAVIFDMDGTLVNVSEIRHLVSGPARDFDAFHRASVDCPAHQWVVRAAHDEHYKGFRVLIVTARSARYRHETAWWLALHHVPSEALYMRGNKDQRPDVEVKRDILRQIRTRYEVMQAYDDNPSVIGLWLSEGIPVIGVPGWVET
jgi:phosphoglycolate phosphatase-like HAD superfamily hydrolase